MDTKPKIKLNVHMYIFLNIILITILTDFLCYFTNWEYCICFFSSTIITLFFNIITKNKIFNIKSDFDKYDILPIIIICLLSIFKLARLDDFIDAITYHLTSQKNPFIDNINNNFLPSSAFFFPLGDRMNYIFVHFLGNRFGLFLTYYALIIVYYQLKNVLNILIPNLSTFKRILFPTILIASNSVIIYAGSYFIDNFSAILLFELIYIFLQNINLLENKKYLYISTFILGCSVGIKLSNMFLALPIIIFLLIKNIKQSGFKTLKNIKTYDYIFLILTAILPFAVYLLKGYVQTGNPFFPLLNNIFHSPYLKNTSGVDPRLGPKNILEFIFWPIIICFDMYRGNDIYALIENTWGVGYILLIYSLLTYKNQSKQIRAFTPLVIFLTLIWIKFLFGYVRYGLVISFCYYIIVFYYLDKLNLSVEKLSTLGECVIYTISSIIIIVLISCFLLINVAYYYYYFDSIIQYNTPYSSEYNNKLSIPYDITDGAWLCTRYNNFYTELIKDDSDPMYNLDIITPLDPMCQLESKYSEYSQELFRDKIKNKNLYIAIPYSYMSFIVELLEINNIEIIENVGIYSDKTNLNPYNFILVAQVQFNN